MTKPTYAGWKWTKRKELAAMKRIEAATPGMTWEERLQADLYPLTDEQKAISARGEDVPLSDEQFCLGVIGRRRLKELVERHQNNSVAMRQLAEILLPPLEQPPRKPYYGPRIQLVPIKTPGVA